MRRVSIIVVLVVGILAACLVVAPRFLLHLAQARAVKKYADGNWVEKMLNTVPSSPPKRIAPALEYTSTVWMSIGKTECALGFPSDRFTRDDNPKRENVVLHHSRYRVLIFSGASAQEFAPVMQPLGFTNLYDFVLSVFRATAQDIPRQPNMDALQRHLVLLDTKAMLAPASFDDSCIEFARGDLRGFIIGDPTRTKNLFVLVYVENKQQFIDLGVIQEAPIQMWHLEELISVLKVGSNKDAAPNRRSAG